MIGTNELEAGLVGPARRLREWAARVERAARRWLGLEVDASEESFKKPEK